MFLALGVVYLLPHSGGCHLLPPSGTLQGCDAVLQRGPCLQDKCSRSEGRWLWGNGGVGSSGGHRGSRWGLGDPHCCMDPRPRGPSLPFPLAPQAHLALVLGGPAPVLPSSSPSHHEGPGQRAWLLCCLSPLGVPHWGQWRWGLPPRATGVRPGSVWEDWRRGWGCSLEQGRATSPVLGDLSARG